MSRSSHGARKLVWDSIRCRSHALCVDWQKHLQSASRVRQAWFRLQCATLESHDVTSCALECVPKAQTCT
eukprot:809778-Amphidinium_carterae.1